MGKVYKDSLDRRRRNSRKLRPSFPPGPSLSATWKLLFVEWMPWPLSVSRVIRDLSRPETTTGRYLSGARVSLNAPLPVVLC
jgi:hypothetical protein